MKAKIETAIFETVTDINKWHDVLGLVLQAAGVSKGIISLRDRLSAELVIPTDVRQELSSPLVCGFSEEEIHAYITQYIAHDPWTEIENVYSSDNPYALSTHIDLQQLQRSKFWEWLAPQGIDDTIVFKIGDSSQKYWVAMNVYYSTEHAVTQKLILDILFKYKNIMQNAWKQGQKIRQGDFKSSYADYFMEQQESPCLLINAKREVLHKNKKAAQFLEKPGSPFFISADHTLRPKDRQLQLEPAMTLVNNKYFSKCGTPEETIHHNDLHVRLSLIGEPESLMGENTALYMVSLCPQTEKCVIWENPILTRREQELVEILAKGGRVVDFQNHYHISKSTAHMHWQNVKEKLNIKDRAELHAAHQIYLQQQKSVA